MKYDVYGIGNALVDNEFEVTDAFLIEQDIEKGLMTLIDQENHDQLLSALQQNFGMKKRAGGGSAANTIVAISQFGGKTFYACKVANDEFGEFYMNDLHAAGVDTHLEQVRNTSEGATGKCMVMVTPDAERTMNTFLGITSDFSASELHLDELKQANWLYVEGYLVTSETSRHAVLHARKVAKQHGVKTAMTFSDPSMATYFKPGLMDMLGEGVDLLFCNQEEAMAFTGTNQLDDALSSLKLLADKLVVTLGAEGALVINNTGRIHIPTHEAKLLDTNGAGDMFAGAFLYGLTQGMGDAEAGKLANLAANRIIQVYGARLDKEAYQEILQAMG